MDLVGIIINLKGGLWNLAKKKLFSVPAGTPGTGRYCMKLAGMASTWSVRPVFKPVRNVDISIPVYILVRYIPAGTVLTTLDIP